MAQKTTNGTHVSTTGVITPHSITTLTTFVEPTPPTTPAEVETFIIKGQIAINTAKTIINSCPANSGLLFAALKFGQKVAETVLDEGVKIADTVRAIGETKGSGPDVEQARADKEKLRKAYNFKKNKLWRNICELDADCVAKAKAEAKANDDIPSINSALAFKNKHKESKTRLKIYQCKGKFANTILSDDIKFAKPVNATSLFANISIGTYLLPKLNINIAVANELHKIRTQIHKALSTNCDVIAGSITDDKVFQQIVDAHKKNDCRFVLMSPPCQSFSKAGSQNINRADATLIVRGMDFLEAVNDRFDGFMCENVPEFLSAHPDKINGYDTIYDYIKQRADELGCITNIDYLDADCYGTPEHRNRAIILGIKKEFVQKIIGKVPTKDNVWMFPKPDEFKITEQEGLVGIPSLEAGESDINFNRLHFTPDLNPAIAEALANTGAGQTSVTLVPDDDGGLKRITLCRAHGDRPAPTITGESSHICSKTMCFPAGRCRTNGKQSDARCRTPYEILVLSGMPRDFELPEKIKIRDNKGNIWCKSGPVPESVPTAIQPGDIVVSDDEFRTMLGEHYCPTVVNRCFKQLIYQIQNKDF